jgi:hypothetical protein
VNLLNQDDYGCFGIGTIDIAFDTELELLSLGT